jgi:hypothetical protein
VETFVINCSHGTSENVRRKSLGVYRNRKARVWRRREGEEAHAPQEGWQALASLRSSDSGRMGAGTCNGLLALR